MGSKLNDIDTCIKIIKRILQLNGDYLYLTDTFINGRPLEEFEDVLTEMQTKGYIKIDNEPSEYRLRMRFTLTEDEQ